MVARTRRVATLTAGSLVTLGSLAALGALTAGPAAADSICPTTLLPGQLCTTVDTVVGSLPLSTTPTTESPTTQPTTQPTTDTTSPSTTVAPTVPSAPSLPVPGIPLLPGPTSPVPDPSAPPSNEGTAPASSTSPGAGDASPASHPATTNRLAGGTASAASVGGARPVVAPIVNGTDAARGFALPALSGSGTASSPFTLGPAPLPTTNAGARGISNELAAPLPAARNAGTDGGGLPRPGAPITLAVLLVAGVLGAHGVRWIDRQMATATVTTTTR